MVFPVVMYYCESWTIKKAEHWRIDVFKLWCWRRLLRVPWTARWSDQSILKEINPEYSLEGLMRQDSLKGKEAGTHQPHHVLFPNIWIISFYIILFSCLKPVNLKGNQPWIFTGRTDAEAEAPILWPPDAKKWLTGKDPNAGREWRWEEKGRQRMRR